MILARERPYVDYSWFWSKRKEWNFNIEKGLHMLKAGKIDLDLFLAGVRKRGKEHGIPDETIEATVYTLTTMHNERVARQERLRG